MTKKIDVGIRVYQCNQDRDGARLVIEDKASGICFLEAYIDAVTLINCFVGDQQGEAKAEVRGLDVLGKTREVQAIHVDNPPFYRSQDRDRWNRHVKASVDEKLVQSGLAAEGWHVKNYGLSMRQSGKDVHMAYIVRFVGEDDA